MSVGWLIAFGLLCMISGGSGYERYMLQKRPFAALFDALLLILGTLIVAHGIDRVLA